MENILICDDEKDIVSALKIYLQPEGYRIFEAYTGKQALEILEKNDIQLVLMDIMMPEMDGISATVRLREQSNIPVILLTAKSESSDKILGLNIGADDYITKPFDPMEVIARVKSQLRRYVKLGGAVPGTGEGKLIIGAIELDDREKSVLVDGESVNLTPLEFSILRLLMQHPGKVFSSEEIYRKIWNEKPIGPESAVAVHIRHIREKVEIDPSNPRYITVVWGQGYRMEEHRA